MISACGRGRLGRANSGALFNGEVFAVHSVPRGACLPSLARAPIMDNLIRVKAPADVALDSTPEVGGALAEPH